MWRLLFKTLGTGILTSSYPAKPDMPPANFRGLPVLDPAKCSSHGACIQACPVGALQAVSLEADAKTIVLDAGRCIYCGLCAFACASGALTMGSNFELAAKRKEDLLIELSTGKSSC